MRWSVQLRYEGTQYCGWQNQHNALSIQQCLEDSLTVLLQKESSIVGCGRTDAGVHARKYYAHFDNEADLPYDGKLFIYKWNSILPRDIHILNISQVSHDWHARYSAISRTYRYYIRPIEDIFQRDFAWLSREVEILDEQLLKDFCKVIREAVEFKPFCKTGSDESNFRCTVTSATWVHAIDGAWIFEISANRFLRGMVRLLVGSAILLCKEKITIGQLQTTLIEQISNPRPLSVPARGLYLEDVEYPMIGLDREEMIP